MRHGCRQKRCPLSIGHAAVLNEGGLWRGGGKNLLTSEESNPLNSNAYREYTPIPAE